MSGILDYIETNLSWALHGLTDALNLQLWERLRAAEPKEKSELWREELAGGPDPQTLECGVGCGGSIARLCKSILWMCWY